MDAPARVHSKSLLSPDVVFLCLAVSSASALLHQPFRRAQMRTSLWKASCWALLGVWKCVTHSLRLRSL